MVRLVTAAQDVRQVYDLMPAASSGDWEVIAKRLAAVPDALRGYAATLREGIDRGVVPARRQVTEVAAQIVRYTADDGFFASFVAEGRIGAYGWSNVTTWRLAQIRGIAEANGWPQPQALQQQHSYLARRAGLRHRSIVSDEQLDYYVAQAREVVDLSVRSQKQIIEDLQQIAANSPPALAAANEA